jgi:hypothetical protein
MGIGGLYQFEAPTVPVLERDRKPAVITSPVTLLISFARSPGRGGKLPLLSYSGIKILVPIFVPSVAFEPVSAGRSG